MGIHLEFLDHIKALSLPRGFCVAELGDQRIAPNPTERRLAQDWYREIGCGTYLSIDGNGRGTMTWDLNRPLPDTIGTYDLVTDFGTGEHVFDQAQVWRTLHNLCTMGGFIVWDRPTQGYPSHGYYCTDPCLFDDLAAANHYRVRLRETRKMPRGLLSRGIWQRVTAAPFVVPQQGRYQASLKI